MNLTIDPVPVRINDRIHLAAQVVNPTTGARGPILSAEGCQFDDTKAEVLRPDDDSGPLCKNCYAPLVGESR